MKPRIGLPCACEGFVDEAALRAIARTAGVDVAGVYGGTGKSALIRNLPGYNMAARQWPWFVLVDLDHDGPCAGAYVSSLLPDRTPRMCLRVAVREIEAWFLADAAALARFLRISTARIPANPDALDDPKKTLVNLARRAESRTLREDIVPRRGSGRPVGPGYAARMNEFCRVHWNVERAAERSSSLARCLAALSKLSANAGG